MILAEIKMDNNSGLDEIFLWGFGGLNVLIDSLNFKAEECDAPDEILVLLDMLENQVELVKSKLKDFDEQYIQPIERQTRKAVPA